MDFLAAVRIYVRVVERGSITGAARDLDIGQPTVSERIDKLEKFLGVRLLMRSARTFSCTDEGKVFYEQGKLLLSSVEQAISVTCEHNRMLQGTIHIASPQCFGETVLPRILARLKTKHPALAINLVLNDMVVDPATEGVDISIRLGRAGTGNYVAHQAGNIDRMLVAAPAYFKKNPAIHRPADLADHPFIRVRGVFSNHQVPLIGPSGALENAPIETYMSTTHWRPMYEMIMAGCGIGVVQQPACAASLAARKLVRILPDYSLPGFPLNILMRAQRPIPLRVRVIVDFLRQHIAAGLC